MVCDSLNRVRRCATTIAGGYVASFERKDRFSNVPRVMSQRLLVRMGGLCCAYRGLRGLRQAGGGLGGGGGVQEVGNRAACPGAGVAIVNQMLRSRTDWTDSPKTD